MLDVEFTQHTNYMHALYRTSTAAVTKTIGWDVFSLNYHVDGPINTGIDLLCYVFVKYTVVCPGVYTRGYDKLSDRCSTFSVGEYQREIEFCPLLATNVMAQSQ